MALLDDLFLPGGFASAPAPVVTGLNDLTKEPLTEQEMMAAAREAAAQKLAGAVKSQARAKSPFPWAGDYAEPSPFPGLGGMGVLADSMPHAAFARDAVPEAPAEPEPGAPQAHINGIPLPRARPVEADGPAHFSLAPPMADGGTIPAAATPAAGAGLPVQQPTPPQAVSPVAASAPAASPGPSFLDRIFNPAHAETMLALGSGFAGAPSFGTGMRRAFGAAVPAMAVDRAYAQKQSGIAEKRPAPPLPASRANPRISIPSGETTDEAARQQDGAPIGSRSMRKEPTMTMRTRPPLARQAGGHRPSNPVPPVSPKASGTSALPFGSLTSRSTFPSLSPSTTTTLLRSRRRWGSSRTAVIATCGSTLLRPSISN